MMVIGKLTRVIKMSEMKYFRVEEICYERKKKMVAAAAAKRRRVKEHIKRKGKF